MRRALLVLVASLVLFGSASAAWGSDASLERALQAYKFRLTSDIAYLASFSAPSRSGAGSALSRLSAIGNDLSGASRAANGQRASTGNGSRGRSDLLGALSDAGAATRNARASAAAARSGNRSSARGDAGAEQHQINRAIPLFEQGGRLLHLF